MAFDRSISRRQLMQSAGAAAAAFLGPGSVLRADAACLITDRAAKVLPTPNFSLLKKSRAHPDGYIAGVRPHRCDGIRLERRPPLSTDTGPKYLIHNYGHGGGGITLSWGCADIVAGWVGEIVQTLRSQNRRPSIAVIGSGVIGLTVAREIKSRWNDLKIDIYAKDLDLTKTCSWVAGGQFEPSGIWQEYYATGRLPVLHSYLEKSQAKLLRLKTNGTAARYGIIERRNYTFQYRTAQGEPVGINGFDIGTPRSVVCDARNVNLPFQNLSTIPGRRYDTWLINPTIMLPKLKSELEERNVRFIAREFRGRAQVYALSQNIIINCTGLGSRDIFGDQKLIPIKGQLAILENPDRLDYFFSGGCGRTTAYMFARQNDIVVGGTYETNRDSTSPDDTTCDTLVANMRRIFNGDVSRCDINNAVKRPVLSVCD